MVDLKRNRMRLLVVAGLAILAIIILFSTPALQKARSLFLGGPLVSEIYSISDSSAIHQVFIGNGTDSVVLSKTPKGWMVNGTAANNKMVASLLNAFQSIDVYSPIPKMVDSVVSGQLHSKSAIVIRFSGSSEPLKEIRFAYTDTLGLGTVALAEGYSTGAVVRTVEQGARLVDLLSVNPSFWVNNRLVTASESEITGVVFSNLENPDSSFSIRREGAGFQVLDKSGASLQGKVNLHAVSRYLNYLNRITAISVEAQNGQAKNPLYTITITTLKGKITLDFIPIPPSTPLDIFGRRARFNYDRLYILMNRTSLYTAYWMDVDLTIKGIGYFYE